MNEADLSHSILSLIDSKRLNEAAEICYTELNTNPNNHIVRLHLARIFFEQGRLSFAARELGYVHAKVPDNLSVTKLLNKISPDRGDVVSGGEEVVIAETEFSVEGAESK